MAYPPGPPLKTELPKLPSISRCITSRLCASSFFFLSAGEPSDPADKPLRIDAASDGGGAKGADMAGGLVAAAAAAAAAALLLDPGNEKNDCLTIGVGCGSTAVGGGGEAGGGVKGSVFQC